MSNSVKKSWISPFVAVTYIAVAFTGILMLLHLRLPVIHAIHQWGGVIFVIGGTTHLLLNWRVLASYFKNSRAAWGAFAGVCILILTALALPSNGHGDRSSSSERGNHHYEAKGGR